MATDWFVYIVRASDNSLYTGISTNVQKRISVHNSRKGSKSLVGKLPVTLVYSEQVTTKSFALKREAEIKSWSREKKLKLINLAP